MKYALIVITVILLCSLAACKDNSPTTKLVIQPANVMIISAATDTRLRHFPGRVEATDKVKLAFEVPGKITQFPVLEGTELKKGDLVASLDKKQFEYNYNQAKAKYTFNLSQLSKFKALYKKGYATELDYDKKKSDLDAARADLNQAKKDLADTTLIAPFDGTVTKTHVKNYQQIQAKEPIINLQNIDSIDINVSIPENIVANLQKKDDRKLTASFQAVPNRTFAVKIKEYSLEADPDTQTYKAVLTMPAPKGINILPGMTATVSFKVPIRGQQVRQIFLLPAGAVFTNTKGESQVWLVDSKTDTVLPQAVSVGELLGNKIQVSKGLKPGYKVVTAGVHFLQQGQKIRPVLQATRGGS